MESQISTTRTSNGSRFCQEFVDIVHMILDGEASDRHKEKFQDYYMKCGTCISYYNLEASTINFIKQKIQQDCLKVSEDLRSQIRNKIGTVSA